MSMTDDVSLDSSRELQHQVPGYRGSTLPVE